MTATVPLTPAPPTPLRICHATRGFPDGAPVEGDAEWDTRLSRIRQAGFDAVLIAPPWLRPAGAPSLACTC